MLLSLFSIFPQFQRRRSLACWRPARMPCGYCCARLNSWGWTRRSITPPPRISGKSGTLLQRSLWSSSATSLVRNGVFYSFNYSSTSLWPSHMTWWGSSWLTSPQAMPQAVNSVWPSELTWWHRSRSSLYPRPTTPAQRSWRGVYWIHLVPPSVRPFVCRRHGFRSISQVCFGISIWNFICVFMVAIGRSLLIFSNISFKMAARRPYWIFWFPYSNFNLALNINFKLQRHNTYVYG